MLFPNREPVLDELDNDSRSVQLEKIRFNAVCTSDVTVTACAGVVDKE
jgi:hypothetical protein